ncbi:hypothetical protein [Pseudofrankia asymbiotica]|uniref:Uncharacterized protein n=1 Tax=Pseudofrankia asymbiotica TaxID=1834516 RepID=A0A1V2IJE7_9ACTN|nr:hypothetical protein [Pseudofrankia asymbiotica]ONH33237.1 hypothetical protein BL253_02380 [Pseudofrankia asymbiotica]
MFRRRRADDAAGDADPEARRVAGADGPEQDEAGITGQVGQLWRELATTVRQANADGGRLPPGVVPIVRDLDDALRPLLEYLRVRPPNGEELRSLTAIISEYLPQALRDYLALPPRYAERPGVTGTSPADDLIRQLVLLDEGVSELQDLVYSGDAAKLAIQARFLDTKFRRSDLDLE